MNKMELTSHLNVRLSHHSVISSFFTENENTFITANQDGTINKVTYQPKFRQKSMKITRPEVTAMAHETPNYNKSINKSKPNINQCLNRIILGTINGDLIILSKDFEVICTLEKKHLKRIVKIQFFDDNKYFLTASHDGSLKIFTAQNNIFKYVYSFYEHQGLITDFSISPTQNVFITACTDQKLRLFDLKKKRCIAVIGPFPFVPTTVLFHPEGKHYFVGFTNGVVACYKLKGAKKVLSVRLHNASVSSIAFHKSGLFLASVSIDSTISILEVERGTILYSMLVKQKGLNSVSFLDNGWQMMTTSVTGRLTIWDFPFYSLVHESSSQNSVENHSEEESINIVQNSNYDYFSGIQQNQISTQTMPNRYPNYYNPLNNNNSNRNNFSYSMKPPNAVYLPNINKRNFSDVDDNNNFDKYSDSNSFASVEAHQVNSNNNSFVNDKSTNIFEEEEEESNEITHEEENLSNHSYKEEEEKHSSHSFKEEENHSSNSLKEEKENHSSHSYKEEENHSNPSFKEEENHSSNSLKEEKENHSSNLLKEENENHSSHSYKEEKENFSSISFIEEENHSSHSYKEEEEAQPNNLHQEEQHSLDEIIINEEEEECKEILDRIYEEEEEDITDYAFKEKEDPSSNSHKEEEKNSNNKQDEERLSIHSQNEESQSHDENKDNDEEKNLNNMKLTFEKEEEEEENSSDINEENILQKVKALISSDISNDDKFWDGIEEEEDEIDSDDIKDIISKFLPNQSSSGSSHCEDENDSTQGNTDLNNSTTDTFNEIAIELKASNTDDYFSESIHDMHQSFTSVDAEKDDNDNSNSFQINKTIYLSTSLNNQKENEIIEDFNASVSIHSSSNKSESPVYDFNNEEEDKIDKKLDQLIQNQKRK